MNLTGLTNFNNHKPLLFACLEVTQGAVLEIGMGEGSTPTLHAYCAYHKRQLASLENNKEYFDQYVHLKNNDHFMWLVKSWEEWKWPGARYGLVFIDHAPAERRHVDAISYADKSQIVVVHDTEHEGLDYDVYHIDKIAAAFKFRRDFSIPNQAPRTTAFSNYIDITHMTIPSYSAI